MSTYYYPRTIQKVTTAFSTIFKGMKVIKYNKNGDVLKEYDVPVTWGPIDKHRDIKKEDYNGTKNAYYQKLPRIAISGPSFTYNADRATDTNGMRQHYAEALSLNDLDSFYSDPVPVPYDYNYTVYIKSDGADYMWQILENILPYFNPDTFLRVKEFSFLDIERDLKVQFGGNATPNFEPFDQSEESRRIIDIQLDFTVEGFMYLPISSEKVIKFIDSKYFINNTTLIDSYSTSGFEGTSAGEVPLDVPTSGFNFSGYSESDNLYYYTSASEN